MKFGKGVDVLWLELKLVNTFIGKLDARRKKGSNRIEPILE